jgi:hypothetical protein
MLASNFGSRRNHTLGVEIRSAKFNQECCVNHLDEQSLSAMVCDALRWTSAWRRDSYRIAAEAGARLHNRADCSAGIGLDSGKGAAS